MANLSANVLFDSYENIEAAQRSLYPFLQRAKCDAIVLTCGARAQQGFELAHYLYADFPGMEIVFRKLPDDSQHRRMTPSQWFDSYAPWSAGGKFTLYDNNEPGTGDLAAQNIWYAGIGAVHGVLSLAGQNGIKVCTVNMQTHNNFDPALLHSTLLYCEKYQHRFSLHYYYGDGFPIDPVHKKVRTYCQQEGIGSFPIYITEVGYCATYMDGNGHLQLDPYKGYHGRRSSDVYGDELVNLAMFYPDLKWFVYGWGDQSPWSEFDISRDNTVQSEIVEHNKKGNPLPVIVFPPETGGVRGAIAQMPSTYVNVRSQPDASADDLGNLVKGERGTFFPDAIHGGWMYFEPDSNPAGWVSLQNGGVVFTADNTPVPPEPTDGYHLTEQQLALLKQHNSAIQTHAAAIESILKEVEPANGGGGF